MGFTSDLAEAKHDGSRSRIGAHSLSGGPQAYHGCGSGVSHQQHLHPAAERVPLPGSDRGSVLKKMFSA